MTNWTPKLGDVVALRSIATTFDLKASHVDDVAPWMSRERQEALEAIAEAAQAGDRRAVPPPSLRGSDERPSPSTGDAAMNDTPDSVVRGTACSICWRSLLTVGGGLCYMQTVEGVSRRICTGCFTRMFPQLPPGHEDSQIVHIDPLGIR